MAPWLLLALVIALALALGYQILNGKSGWRVLLYWPLILVSLLAAEVLVESIGWNFTRLGDLRIVPDVAAGLGMVGVLWLVGL